MARKLAGVTKDNKVYESRFGMFMASNTQGARFSIQCVGAVDTTQMELAGDPNSHDSAIVALRHEFTSPDTAIVAAEASEGRSRLQKSLEETGSERELHLPRVNSSNSPTDKSRYFYESDGPLAIVASPNKEQPEQEDSFSGHWSRGAAFVKGAYRKYKPLVMARLESSTATTQDQFSYNGSNDNVLPQTETYQKDLGLGIFPTVQISSRPDGHLDGTLQISDQNVQTHRRQLDMKREGQDDYHLRFLKLRAYHVGMAEPCHGIVNLIDPTGISVISDIDDTIKETNIAAGARIIFRNTFLKEMQDVPGMSQVYRQWWKQGAAIHYVSNSPWQLIPSLLEFFHSHKFPPGSAHLRLHDSVLKTYFMTPGESKRRAIDEILTDFPGRRFILVGDSGEIDMEM
jgi:hypothetical protein